MASMLRRTARRKRRRESPTLARERNGKGGSARTRPRQRRRIRLPRRSRRRTGKKPRTMIRAKKSDDVPLYRTFGSNQTLDVTATAVPPAFAAHRNGSPKGHAATAASSIPDQSDDDNVPLSTSYARKRRRQEKQAPAPDAAAVPLTGVEKPLSRRQTKPPRRAPVATPSTSESD
ncbi:hypothetical protein C3747_7g523 [Trypanosoma cruzi]|uniref:Uncharacterized protein n=1 Tax=Trypanosoma cruzi TaxID=5693 RepID=A0A2V2XGW6_TRYCR|nr:hypothetical protein C3747_7g523 [Trypanosoma cruzi]